MKRITSHIIWLTLFAVLYTSSTAGQTHTGKGIKSVDVNRWIATNFAKGVIPPFSFEYGGKHSDEFIKGWKFAAGQIQTGMDGVQRSDYTYSDKATGLEVRCEVAAIPDFQTVEWTLHFVNASAKKNSPLISKVAAADYNITYRNKGRAILHYARGSDGKRDDFQPMTRTLEINDPVYMTPQGGRSSDGTGFPFFNLETPDQSGMMAAVGWTGKWYANVNKQDDHSVSLKAGMENLSLYLEPGEQIRSPKICLMFWQGSDRMVGHNQFRRLILAHYTRKIDQQLPVLPFAAFLDREGPLPCNEHVCATESHAVADIRRRQQFGIVPEVFWLDAGWYPCDGSWPNVGNWTPNKANFPNGLRPLSDASHEAGAKFLLWFEPERVTKNKPYISIDKDHPEWMTELAGNRYLLFNLGNTEARLWLTNHISTMIRKEGIDYYRQDFNIDPAPYWKKADPKGRTGMAEIRHIEGLYAFWDSLLARFPGLIIDNCAAGGRRLDLETTSRSFPFWRTDYSYGEPMGSQCHTYGLNFYLPLTGTGSFELSTYHFRSAMSSHMVTDWNINSKLYKQSDMRRLIQEFKDLRPFYYEADYYPLTDTTNFIQDNVWLSYQMNRSDKGDGIVMAFRRSNAVQKTIQVRLKGLEAAVNYEVRNLDTGEKFIRSAAELSGALTLTLEQAPGSICLAYKKSTP